MFACPSCLTVPTSWAAPPRYQRFHCSCGGLQLVIGIHSTTWRFECFISGILHISEVRMSAGRVRCFTQSLSTNLHDDWDACANTLRLATVARIMEQ